MDPLPRCTEDADDLGRDVAHCADAVRHEGVELRRFPTLELVLGIAEQEPYTSAQHVEPLEAVVGAGGGRVDADRHRDLVGLDGRLLAHQRDDRDAVVALDCAAHAWIDPLGRQEVVELDAQVLGQRHEQLERRLSLPGLEPREGAGRHLCPVGEVLEGPPKRLARGAQTRSDLSDAVVHGGSLPFLQDLLQLWLPHRHGGGMQTPQWDVVVIGGSIAGLSAAQMLGRARRATLVVDAGEPRNRFTGHMHGVLGHDGTNPADLLARGRAEVQAYGVELREGRVAELSEDDDGLRISLVGGEVLTARAAIIATGVVDRLPEIEGLADRWGRDVLHCPYCHGYEVAGRRLGVVATSPASVHQIGLVRQWSDDVTAFVALAGTLDEATHAGLVARGIRVVPSPVRAVETDADALTGVTTVDGERYLLDAVFAAPAPEVDLGFATGLGLARADLPGAPLAVDATGATSHPRVWAAGNVVAPSGNVPLSMGSGSMAGAGVNAALVADDTARAVAARRDERNAGWEARYADVDGFWSGRVNATVSSIVASLDPGTALDVGCGEGGDAVWLAEHGWTVTGVDVSGTAIRRAADAARARGLGTERVTFAEVDAVDALPDGTFDLVTASFLHSWERDFPRLHVLRTAAGRVAPGGHLLVVSHVTPPPWVRELPPEAPILRDPRDELTLLALPADEWAIEIAESRPRDIEDPDGNPAVIDDGVLLLRRLR